MSPDTNPYASPATIREKPRAGRRMDAQTNDFYTRYRNALCVIALSAGGTIATGRMITSDTAKAAMAVLGVGGIFAGAKLSDKKDA